MPLFRITYCVGARTNSTVIEARTQAEAREAFSRARIPGVGIVSVEPDSDAAPTNDTPGTPPPKTPATHAAKPRS